jgi:hypothetical protein
MDTAHSLPPPPPDPADDTTASASSSASFWTGAPRLLAGLATVIGSIVGLATVLVQAGVIGSSSTATQTGRAKTAPPIVAANEAPSRPGAARTLPVVAATAQTPSLDQALGDLNELLAESARTKGDLGSLIEDVRSTPSAIGRSTALREIDRIVQQREGLHAELAAFPTPADLSKAVALLRDSITASLADDRLVRQWIVAHYDGDVAAERLWRAQLEASHEATRAKNAFRAEYADRLLSQGRSSVIPNY